MVQNRFWLFKSEITQDFDWSGVKRVLSEQKEVIGERLVTTFVATQ
jgi:hypothetical protein